MRRSDVKEMRHQAGMSMGQKKMAKVMGEFKRGMLHSGSKKGPKVKNRKQAVAIGLNSARKHGYKVPGM
jgi:hypothetical protein